MKQDQHSEQDTQREVISELLKSDPRKDLLFWIVKAFGPAVISKAIHTNTETVYSRIRKPGTFKHDEMQDLSLYYNIGLLRISELIHNQKAANATGILNTVSWGHPNYKEKNSEEDKAAVRKAAKKAAVKKAAGKKK